MGCSQSSSGPLSDVIAFMNAKHAPKVESKYFLPTHQARFAKMIPPADAMGNEGGDFDTIPVMADLTKMGGQIDGKSFAQLVFAGYISLETNMNRLNKENEFPIPDGDTGTNMVICFKKSVRELIRNVTANASPSIISASDSFGEDVVMNGQGNSGTILSHFFQTLGAEVKKHGKDTLTTAEFAACLVATGATMNSAVSQVFEGTMISVARDGVDGLTGGGSIADLFAEWSSKCAKVTLATHETLMKDGKPVLKGLKGLDGKPKVDSGASGFAVIVEGMAKGCTGAISAAQMQDASVLNAVGIQTEENVIPDEDHSNLLDYPFRYCTETAFKIKPGTTRADIAGIIEKYQADKRGDSMAMVVSPAVAKLHIHTNTPGDFFDLFQPFNSEQVLFKEKVEDLFSERDQAARAAYDMSKAKVHIVTDAAMLPYHELDQGTTLPIWIIDGVEPRILGDKRVNIFDVANANRRHVAEKGVPKKLDTAAPTPEQAELAFRQALDKVHNHPTMNDILCINLSAMMSATDRNVREAVRKLPEEAQGRIHVYDSGYLGPNMLMAREAMRCAAAGMSLEEIMARVQRVEQRLFSFFVVDSDGLRNLAAWGRVVKQMGQPPVKLKADEVEGGKHFSLGTRPSLDPKATPALGVLGAWPIGGSRDHPKVPRVPMKASGSRFEAGNKLTHALKAVNTFARLADVPSTATAVEDIINLEVEHIKSILKPGQVVKDVCIGTPIRHDRSVELGKQIKEKLGSQCEGEVTTIDSLVIPALLAYGQFCVCYWIDDVAAS